MRETRFWKDLRDENFVKARAARNASVDKVIPPRVQNSREEIDQLLERNLNASFRRQG